MHWSYIFVALTHWYNFWFVFLLNTGFLDVWVHILYGFPCLLSVLPFWSGWSGRPHAIKLSLVLCCHASNPDTLWTWQPASWHATHGNMQHQWEPVLNIWLQNSINPCHTEFILQNLKLYFHSPSFINNEMVQRVYIFPCGKQWSCYPV